MLTKLTLILILAMCLTIYLVSSCSDSTTEDPVETHCGRCHLTPEPELLPAAVWRDGVLPRMEFYLGRKKDHPRHPLRSLSMEEQVVVGNSGLYSTEILADDPTWNEIVQYYLDRSTNYTYAIPEINEKQKIFDEYAEYDPKGRPPVNSLVEIDTSNGLVWTGSGHGLVEIFRWDNGLQPDASYPNFNLPVDVISSSTHTDILDMGLIMPNDRSLGQIKRFENEQWVTTSDGLKRPVSMTLASGGETVIAEFGHMTGYLSVQHSSSSKKVLVNQPGAVKVVYEDMDNDGSKEIVSLFGQGDEGVVICSDCDGELCCTKAVNLHPLFGSSDMEVIDMDGDQLPDLVLASGDNADYSMVPKDYHGIYFFRNKGSFTFEQNHFIPMHGCTNVEVMDVDLDGDIDLVASSFFPVVNDSMSSPSLIFFENEDGNFSGHSFERANLGRWLVMDSGDIDADGDSDVVVGSFSMHPSPVSVERSKYWREEGATFLVLENRTK